MKKSHFTTTFPAEFLEKLKIEAVKQSIPVNKLIINMFEDQYSNKDNN